MKQLLVFSFFSLFYASLFAQSTPRIEQLGDNRRTETHAFILGGDSVRYTILGANDTLATDVFWLNGQLQSRAWKKDSTHYYRQFGQLVAKEYHFLKKKQEDIIDSTCLYNLKGAISGTNVLRNKQRTVRDFEHFSGLKAEWTYLQLPHGFYNVNYKNNIKTRAYRGEVYYKGQDSFRLNVDSTFYPNGRLKTIDFSTFQIIEKYEFNEWQDNVAIHHRAYYDSDGQKLYSLTADSSRLFVFKDNIGCYYGFKNRHGDTVIAPRFDNVKRISYGLWLCEEGENKILMRLDGSILTKQKMHGVKNLNGRDDSEYKMYSDDEAYFLNNDSYQNPTLLVFEYNKKYGVMDTSGKIILPPQYPEIYQYSPKLQRFLFREMKGFYASKTGVIDAKTGEILLNGRFKFINSTKQRDYFTFTDSLSRYDKPAFVGLMNQQGDTILPARYLSITAVSPHLFWASLGSLADFSSYDESDTKLLRGLYDAQNKRWVHQPIYTFTERNPNKNKILFDTQKRQCGLVDSLGNWLLPVAFDTIVVIDRMKYIVSKKGEYVVYDIEKRKNLSQTYQYLSEISLYNEAPSFAYFSVHTNEYQIYYIAKKQGKWGVIDDKEDVIIPFEYDYGGYFSSDKQIFSLVKGETARIFYTDFFPKPFSKTFFAKEEQVQEVVKQTAFEDANTTFLINFEGKILVPPQYKIVSDNKYYDPSSRRNIGVLVATNKDGKRQLIFSNTGTILDLPFSQPIYWAVENCPTVVLGKTKDSDSTISVGNLKTGKILHRIPTGALSIADAQNGTYFVKTTVPPEPKLTRTNQGDSFISTDSLTLDDSGWLMYDALGQQISKDTFRFPIPFYGGIGCGMVGEKWGLWQSDGKVLAPPQYENAVHDKEQGSFAFFQNIGLNTWLVLFDKKGKQLVGTGHYESISDFYGKYAVVKKGAQVALIDSFGKEIVPLTDISRSYKVNFRDSLSLNYKKQKGCLNCDTLFHFGKMVVFNHDYHDLPIEIFERTNTQNNPDSLQLSNELRNIVWNTLLSTRFSKWLHTAAEVYIDRAKAFRTYPKYLEMMTYRGYNKMRWGRDYAATELLYEVFADSQYLSFCLLKDSSDHAFYHNYWNDKGVWKRLQTADLFNLKGDNVRGLNELLVRKVRQIKDKDIDCGADASFWERAQTRYLVRKEGLVFYFNTKLPQNVNGGRFEQIPFETMFVPIEVTWAELKPFLRH